MRTTCLCLVLVAAAAGAAPIPPLVDLAFDEGEGSNTVNRGSIGGSAVLEHDEHPLPAWTSGSSGKAADRALLFPGQQVNTHDKYTRYSRVALPTRGELDHLSQWTLCFWFTAPRKPATGQGVLFSTMDQQATPRGGIYVAMNASKEGRQQFRVSVADEDWYTAVFSPQFDDRWTFAALVYDQGALQVFIGDRQHPPRAISEPRRFKTTSGGDGEDTVLVGSTITRFANQDNHDGAIDRVYFTDRVMSGTEIEELRKEGAGI